MRTRLKALVTWGVLALASGCGGQVVVDPGSGSSDDISGGVCEAYCDLVAYGHRCLSDLRHLHGVLR